MMPNIDSMHAIVSGYKLDIAVIGIIVQQCGVILYTQASWIITETLLYNRYSVAT